MSMVHVWSSSETFESQVRNPSNTNYLLKKIKINHMSIESNYLPLKKNTIYNHFLFFLEVNHFHVHFCISFKKFLI